MCRWRAGSVWTSPIVSSLSSLQDWACPSCANVPSAIRTTDLRRITACCSNDPARSPVVRTGAIPATAYPFRGEQDDRRPMNDRVAVAPRRLDHSVRVGMSFGLTSGVITTLGLLVGLSAGTSSRVAVLGGILTIAVADSLSDALGIHVSEESEGVHTPREIWTATVATFVAKLVSALVFGIPVLAFDLDVAVVVSVVWGAVALTALSLDLARRQGLDPKPMVVEHLSVAALVVVASHGVGLAVSSLVS